MLGWALMVHSQEGCGRLLRGGLAGVGAQSRQWLHLGSP